MSSKRDKLTSKFTQIVAVRLHNYEEQLKGVKITQSWKERYEGTPKEKLPPTTAEYNWFRLYVDQFVAALMGGLK